MHEPLEDCSRCVINGAFSEHLQAEQWCTRLDNGPATWGPKRRAPRVYMGGGREVGSAPAETRGESEAHGCLGAYTRAPFLRSVEAHTRRKGRSNRLYDQADHRVIEFVHYYEGQLDAVAALAEEYRLSG